MVDECPVCSGSAEPGWVCEERIDRPWQHDGCGGAGAPCVCNPKGIVRWRKIFAAAVDDAAPY